nr:hypothetical protein [Kibdelosporangium sp. MJ126-NF4]
MSLFGPIDDGDRRVWQQRGLKALTELPMWVRMTQAARRVFSAAQDRGEPWGVALDAALAVRPYQRTAVST